MKIGVVQTQFGSLLKGGAEVQAENTIKALEKNGIEIVRITPETTLETLMTCNLVHFFKSENYFSILAEFLVSKKIPYVVSSVFFPETNAQLLKNKLFRFAAKKLKTDRFVRVGRFYLWDNAEYIFPNTTDEAEILKALYVSGEKVRVVKNAVEDEYFEQNIQENIFLSQYPQMQYKKYVLNVGRIEKRKKQLELIKACKYLDLPLVLIGDVRDAAYWHECMKLGHKQLLHVGFKNDKQFLKDAYRAASVFCLPSTMETPGLTAMEAYLQGTQIVVTKNGGAKDYFADSVFYVDPKSTEDIIKKISMSFSSPKSHDVDLRELKYINIAKEYINFYKEITKRCGRLTP